jgi:phosphoribosylanthranilate isomerase
MMKWKVCGMRDPENIEALIALQPHYVGFIFWKPSKRFFEGTIPAFPEHIQKVGVFVDATEDFIKTKVATHQLQAVQLHGNETPEYCKKIKSLTGSTIIKAFAIAPGFDFSTLTPYEACCDYFLLDTKGETPGGTGVKFNWEVLQNYTSSTPFFLSGGIGPEDAAAICEISKTKLPLHAIDLNSKFELYPGMKNITALHHFKKQLPCNTM